MIVRSFRVRWWVWAGIAALLAFAVLYVRLATEPDRATIQYYQRIRLGMTRGEVQAILGKPWDDSLCDPDAPSSVLLSPAIVLGGGKSVDDLFYYNYRDSADMFYRPTLWYGKGILIGAVFDENGVLIGKGAQRIPEEPQRSLPSRMWHRVYKRVRG
jgi:hypothetical protein